MSQDSFPKVLLDRHPELPAVMAAIDEFKANRPISQRSPTTGELMVVREDRELGILTVVCDGKVVYRAKHVTPRN
jgi:hypothetical protein